MSPPIREGSGSSIGSIRLGDGTEISEVRTGAGDVVFSAIPDSVVNQYVAEGFADPWPDEVGTANMSIVAGLVQSTFSNGETSVFGDGNDDAGKAATYDVPTQTSWGIAFTIEAPSSQNKELMGYQSDSSDSFSDVFKFGDNSGFEFFYRVNNTDITVEATTTIFDNTPHTVVVQMNGNSASDIEIYVDDMTTDVSNVTTSNTVTKSNWSTSKDFGFYAINSSDPAALKNFFEADMGAIEFNSSTYSETERQGFVDRRPEV